MRKRTAGGKSTTRWRLSFWRFSIGFRIITALFHKKQAAQQGSLFFDTRRGLERPLKKRAGGTFLGRGRVLSDFRRIL